MMQLRCYQNHAVAETLKAFDSGVRSALLVMATGCGKTVIFSEIIKRMKDRGRAIVIAHRDELIRQAANKISIIADEMPDIEKGDQYADQMIRDWQSNVIVSSVQTQVSGRGERRRMHRFDPSQFALMIIDEAHHAAANSYRAVIGHYRQNENICVLGVTATPDRHDEKALGQIFDEVPFVYGIADAIRDGWLVDIDQQFVKVESLDYSGVRTTAGDLNGADLARQLEYEQSLQGMANPTYDIADGRKTLIFAASIAQAERIAEILNRRRDECATLVTGKTKSDDRRNMLREYARGDFQFLVNVGVATEGFDEPTIEVISMCRPTKSRALYEQMLGRGTRTLPGTVDGIEDDESQHHLPYDGETEQSRIRKQRIAESGKKSLLILDFVGNSGRHHLITAIDVLGGKYDDDILELAERKAHDGQRRNVSETIRQTIDEIEATKRRHIVAAVKASTKSISPFRKLGMEPERVPEWEKGKLPTEKMIDTLGRHKVKWKGLTRFEAGKIIDEIFRRQREGICSPRQSSCVSRAGFNPQMNAGNAGRIISVLSANSWRWPQDVSRPNYDGDYVLAEAK